MDVFSATAAVLRRWYVALPILLLAGYLAMQQYQSVEPLYNSSAQVVLLPPPPREPSPEIIDPEDLQTPLDPAIAGLGNSSRLIGGLVEQNLENPVVRDQLEALGATADYSVGVNSRLPLMSFSVTGTHPAVTAQTLDNLVVAAGSTLEQVQRDLGATTDAIYRMRLAAPLAAPEQVDPERNRALIATLVGGAALAFFLALLFDNAMAALRSRRRAKAPAATSGDRGQSAGASTTTPRRRPWSPKDGVTSTRLDGPDGPAGEVSDPPPLRRARVGD